LVVASLASVTLLAMILGPKRPAYVLTGLNLLLFALATVLLLVRAAVLEPAITAMMGFFALAFAIESAATALTVWSRNSPGRRRQGAKPEECHS
jgi:hypothetical protein